MAMGSMTKSILVAVGVVAVLFMLVNAYLLSLVPGEMEAPAATRQTSAQLPSRGAGREAPADKTHFAWVTDCSEYQEWQSLALLWSIYKHQGPQTAVTRLISGCNATDEEKRRQTHRQLFATEGHRPPELFFTSGYIRNEALNDTYPPYNRPHSVALWTEAAKIRDETMIVFLDPDMMMLAPLELPMLKYESKAQHIYRMALPLEEAQALPALGQRYKYMSNRWAGASLKLEEVCEATETCLSLTETEVAEFYAVGPPWIPSFGDLRRAAPLWREYVPKVRQQYRQLIAEMYAYSLAFATNGVRHALFDHFVVSYPGAPVDEQAWTWIDGGSELDFESLPIPAAARVPTFLHYCEIYFTEEWYWRKRNVPHSEILRCESPLFAEPPLELLQRKRAAVAAGDNSSHALESVRQVWYFRMLTMSLNEALLDLKTRLCSAGFNDSRSLHVPYPKGSFYDALSNFFKNDSR